MSKSSAKELAQHTSLTSPFRYYPSALPDLNFFFPPHWHNEFELNYIRSGRAVFYYNGVQFIPEAGDIFIFQPNQTHSMTTLGNEKIYYDTLLFTSDSFGPQGERGNQAIIGPLVSGDSLIRQPINRSCAGYEVIRQTVESMVSAAKLDTPSIDLLLKGDLLHLFYYLHNFGHITYRQNEKAANEERIRPVLSYISQHFAEDLTVDMLAQLIPLSKSYFMYCFKRITGTSVVSYITQIRIKNACEMLLSTGKQVVRIAMECGFDNLSNFNRQFKKNVGCSPLKYRKPSCRSQKNKVNRQNLSIFDGSMYRLHNSQFFHVRFSVPQADAAAERCRRNLFPRLLSVFLGAFIQHLISGWLPTPKGEDFLTKSLPSALVFLVYLVTVCSPTFLRM